MSNEAATMAQDSGRPVSAPWPDTLEARVAELLRAGEPVVLVTIVASRGSTPRHAGTRALQTLRGFEGTVGGGILEARAMQAARQSFEDALSRSASFTLDASARDDMVCGGSMEVFCEVLTPAQADMFATAATLLRNGVRGIWTVARTGKAKAPSADIVSLDRRLHVEPAAAPMAPGIVAGPDHIRPYLEETGGRPGIVPGTDGDIYVEPLDAPPVLLLCGGGHVSLEVAGLAQACGFVVDVADDRPEFANARRFPMARQCHVLPGYAGIAAKCAVSPRHFVAIMTRGHAFDLEVLGQVLSSPARYVGMIGSKSKKEHVYAALRATGVSEAALARVCCPIGLSIRAETPQQIAVSVVAELLAAKGNVLPQLRNAQGAAATA